MHKIIDIVIDKGLDNIWLFTETYVVPKIKKALMKKVNKVLETTGLKIFLVLLVNAVWCLGQIATAYADYLLLDVLFMYATVQVYFSHLNYDNFKRYVKLTRSNEVF